MAQITRREFTTQAMANLGATILASGAAGQTQPLTRLPTVRWGKHEISRLLVGHNPIKGISHFSRDLDREMLVRPGVSSFAVVPLRAAVEASFVADDRQLPVLRLRRAA